MLRQCCNILIHTWIRLEIFPTWFWSPKLFKLKFLKGSAGQTEVWGQGFFWIDISKIYKATAMSHSDRLLKLEGNLHRLKNHRGSSTTNKHFRNFSQMQNFKSNVTMQTKAPTPKNVIFQNANSIISFELLCPSEYLKQK